MKSRTRILFSVVLSSLLLLGVAITVQAQALSPGDIAIIGINCDNPDEFAFVTFVDLQAGTVISFTDNGFKSDGHLTSNEGTKIFTAPGVITAGTVITFDDGNFASSGNFALANKGDQIIAYQGFSSNPTFIYALNDNSTSNDDSTGWQTDAGDAHSSALPTGLTNGDTAVAIDEVDNAVYTGDTSDTVANLRSYIGNKANWSGDDTTRQTMPTGPFTGPNAVTVNQLAGRSFPWAGVAAAFVLAGGLVVLRKRH